MFPFEVMQFLPSVYIQAGGIDEVGFNPITGSVTVTISDPRQTLVDPTGGAVTITLPPQVPIVGYTQTVINASASANTITVNGNGPLINGAASYSFNAAYGVRRFQYCPATGTQAAGYVVTVGDLGAVIQQLNAMNVLLGLGNAVPVSGRVALDGARIQNTLGIRAIRVVGDGGSRVLIGNGSSSSSSITYLDQMSITLVAGGTYDYDITSAAGGFVTLSAPAAAGATIGGTVYFGADAVTTLGGLAPTNLSTTLGTSGKINVAASTGKVRIQNSTAGTLTILAQFNLVVSG